VPKWAVVDARYRQEVASRSSAGRFYKQPKPLLWSFSMKDRHLQWIMGICFVIATCNFVFFFYDANAPLRKWFFWLFIAAIGLHQIEEYVLFPAVLGERYYFRTWFRWATGMKLSVNRAFGYNIPMTYPVFITAAWVGESFILLPLVVVFMEAINGAWHLSLTTTQSRLSPGVITGALLYVPAGFYVARLAVDLGTPWWQILAAWLSAAFGHYMLVGGLMPKSPQHPLIAR